MPEEEARSVRFVGLDVHRHYLVATAVDADKNEVMPLRRVPLVQLDDWVRKNLTPQDAVVLEMTTNTWQFYEVLASAQGVWRWSAGTAGERRGICLQSPGVL